MVAREPDFPALLLEAAAEKAEDKVETSADRKSGTSEQATDEAFAGVSTSDKVPE